MFIMFLGLLFAPSLFSEPQRSEGLSVHWLPSRVSPIEEGEKAQTKFMIDGSPENHVKTPEELIVYFKSLSAQVQENGIWLVVTHPDAYSDKEKMMKEELIKLCKQNNIPLFICRGQDLPNGWGRQ